MKLIDSNHTKLLAKSLDAYSQRRKAIASNISNIDTPGYKKQKVSFEDQLREAQKISNRKDDFKDVQPETQQTDEPIVLEDELMNLSDTQIRVQIATRGLRHSMGMLRNAIRGQAQ